MILKFLTDFLKRKEEDMDPATISALLAVGLRVIDYLEKRGGEGGLDDEMLVARDQIRRELARQAEAEGSKE